jgi:hypothetical protein
MKNMEFKSDEFLKVQIFKSITCASLVQMPISELVLCEELPLTPWLESREEGTYHSLLLNPTKGDRRFCQIPTIPALMQNDRVCAEFEHLQLIFDHLIYGRSIDDPHYHATFV